MEKYGECPVCGEVLDPDFLDVNIYKNDSFDTIVRKLLDEHFRTTDCILEVIKIDEQNEEEEEVEEETEIYGQCPICKYELDPVNCTAYFELTDSFEYAARKMLEAHFEASPECLRELVNLPQDK